MNIQEHLGVVDVPLEASTIPLGIEPAEVHLVYLDALL
jgi:hypothetical protein